MSRRAQPAACSCGQVLFDTGGRKEGDVLTCPWCEKKYRYLGDEKIAPIEEKAEPIEEVSDELEVVEGSEEVIVARIPAKPNTVTKKPKKRDKPDRPLTGTKPLSPVGDEGAPRAPSVRTKQPKEIPGGVGVMIVFIIAFNAIAFIGMSFVIVTQPDKSRLAIWGQSYSSKAIWPELAALLIGHIVGFIAWSCYVYTLHGKKQDGDDGAAHGARKKQD